MHVLYPFIQDAGYKMLHRRLSLRDSAAAPSPGCLDHLISTAIVTTVSGAGKGQQGILLMELLRGGYIQAVHTATRRALSWSRFSVTDHGVSRAYARGRRGIRVMELLQRAGEKPSPSDAEALSFWTANLLPMETADRLRLLSLTHTRDRLAYELALFNEHSAAGETCAVM